MMIDGENVDPFEKALRDIGEWDLARLWREGGFTKKEIIAIGVKKAKGTIAKLNAISTAE